MVSSQPAVLVGDSLYWILKGGSECILEFDLQSESLAFVQMPVDRINVPCYTPMRADDGELGLLSVTGTTAQLWKRKAGCDGATPWWVGRTIELDKLLSLDSGESTWIQGFAEDKNLVFLCAGSSNFTVQLESLQLKKLSNPRMDRYHPFGSVYAAGNNNAFTLPV
uniref:F-box protein AT5G49610-like beta-propeller domain-containing protein n=1 Tax=Aegilops tauschii subsp. strangulata TaxID=200361 RepID=A0A453MYF0_AEGTS